MNSTEVDLRDLIRVTTWNAPYDYCHDRYQAYYSTGLGEILGELGIPFESLPLQRMPGVLAALRRVRSSYRLAGLMKSRIGTAIDRIAARVGGSRVPPGGRFHSLAGQYEFAFRDGPPIRLVLDAQDGGEIADPDLMNDCDVYAKSNFREDIRYDGRVVPVCNGNPIVLPHRKSLNQLRDSPAEYDICFVVRVWGGRHDEAGIEHNLRLLEAVNKVECRKYILAYLVAGDIDRQESRLRKLGIKSTRTPVGLQELWKVSASSRINVVRLGMHNCVPWRFMDLLAMGACVALDQRPQTVWAPPLVEGFNFLSLNATTSPDHPLADDADYSRIPGRIEQFLAEPDRLHTVRQGAMEYFDLHACPRAVGRCLLNYVGRIHSGRVGRMTPASPEKNQH